MVRRVLRVLRIGLRILRRDGLIRFTIAALEYVERRRALGVSGLSLVRRKTRFDPPVHRADVLAADFASRPYDPAQRNPRRTKVLSWVMSPPGNGGGHQNIFRFIDFLADAGYTNHVYLYSVHHPMELKEAIENVSHYSNPARLHFHQWEGSVVDSDVVFATGWETAYPVFNVATDGAKFYFVQDYEPSFYPVGSTSLLAENTYRFGFHGITAGGWLKHKLHTDFGMECDSYEFAADSSLYSYRNSAPRKEIFFYARPVTERRAFELGIMALELFHRAKPEYTINLAGWDVSAWDVPFPYVNHKSLKLRDLPDLYDRCAAAVVLSLTNMSLLPLELLGSGVIPVVNDGPNNRMVSDNPYLHYTLPTPQAMADELVRLVERPDLPEYAKAASDSVRQLDWATAGAKVVEIIDQVTGGGS
ncbi:MAG: glycosyltransferase family 1 protein [Actinomycetia bacterium]|nr:glycosyltransferase family 1 protein [Actinomycetes bacterium]